MDRYEIVCGTHQGMVRSGNEDAVYAHAGFGLAILADGMGGYAAGEIASREESFGGLGTAILVATFGILMILVLEFRTFRGMLIVSTAIQIHHDSRSLRACP